MGLRGPESIRYVEKGAGEMETFHRIFSAYGVYAPTSGNLPTFDQFIAALSMMGARHAAARYV
jgi:hypothetical protein